MSLGMQVLRLRHKARVAALQAAGAWRRSGPRIGRPLFVGGCFGERFDGNAFDFALRASHDPRVRFVAVAPTEEDAGRLRSHGVRAVVKRSFQELVALELADAVFTVGHLRSDFSAAPNPTALRVMLWHATPMKAVGKLNKPIPDPIDHYDLVTATSEFTSRIMRDAFADDETEVVITGHPKTDRLLEPFDGAPIRQALGLAPGARVISYLPTWRHDFAVEHGGDFGRNAGPLLRVMKALAKDKTFAAMLERHDAVFLLKPHPLDDLDQLKALAGDGAHRIRTLDPDDIDTVDLMRLSEVVVTDYSGALTDWLLLAKPLVCFTYDYDDYWTNRGSPSFDFKAAFDDVMVATQKDLVGRLDRSLADPDAEADARGKLSRLMHRHRDGAASQRIVDATLRTLRARRASARAWAA